MVRTRWQCFHASCARASWWSWPRTGALIAALAVAGCKTSGTNPSLSWWPGSGKDANAKLASAAGHDDAVKKPSETQSPYPTTSTPESYALDGTKSPAASGPSAPSVAPTMVISPGMIFTCAGSRPCFAARPLRSA